MKTKIHHSLFFTLACLIILHSSFCLGLHAQGTAFTYQGRLNNGSAPAGGSYDLTFTLYPVSVAGGAVAGPLTNSAVAVTNGLFTTTIDFGDIFSGTNYWLEIAVRTNATGSFTTLAPRQQVTPAPYAIYSTSAGTAASATMATTATSAGSVSAANITGTILNSSLPNSPTFSGTVMAGSFLGNGAGLTNLNAVQLSGNATLTNLTLKGILQLPLPAVINVGNGQLLEADNNENFFAGLDAGVLTTSGGNNTANGDNALRFNISGYDNTVSGFEALLENNTGSYNTAIGESTLFYNRGGFYNTAIGGGALGTIGGSNGSNGGTNNIALGYLAGNAFNGNESSNIDIGNVGVLGENNTIRIGSGQAQTFIAGTLNGDGGGLTNLNALTNSETGVTLGGTFSGNGTGLTGLNASSLSSGTVPNSVLSGFQGSDNAIGGGVGNTINGSQSAILGGQDNTVNASQSSIGGGSGNNIQTGAYYALIGSGGGDVIQASAYDSVIGGGYHNLIGTNAIVSFIGSGQFNTISNNATFAVLGGGLGNTNTGPYSVIPGGEYNVAASNSFAAGSYARATNSGSFVWSDDSSSTPFASTNNNSFNVRANGGVVFVTGGTGVAVDGASILTATPGAIQESEIDDGGSSAYTTFQQTLQAAGGDTSLAFSELSPLVSTNGTPPAFTLTVNGAVLGTVTGFSGCEGISRPYSYVVEVLNSTTIQPNAEVGLSASLSFSRNGRSTTFAGTITACTLAASSGTGFVYTMKIESPLANLNLTTDYKIYQKMTLPVVITSVYNTYAPGAPMTQSLSGSYSAHDSFTQFGETALNFFSRILENDGVFYFFNQGATPPGLVIGDSPAAYLSSPNSPFPYYGNSTTNVPAGVESIRTFQNAVHQSTRTSTVNAYDFENPGVAEAESSTATAGVGLYYEFGNTIPSQTYDSTLAGNREGVQTANRSAISGSATAPDLRAGYTFALADQTGAGLGGTYLVTSVHHAGFVRITNGVSTFYYGNQFAAIPASLNYRPALTTPRPLAQPCTAKVTAASGEDITTDKYGRVHVLFHWDHYDADDDTSSEWIRVASPWAGSGRGMIFIPRVGDEVLVSFIQGDPDQPVITGSLYNGDNPVPFDLPDNDTVSGIKTLSSPGGGGNNMLTFDDKSGSELITLVAQNDMDQTVNNNLNEKVDENMTLNVLNNLSITAGNQITLNGPLSLNGSLAVAGVISGNGNGLTNLNALTNSETGVTLGGTFSGNGTGLTGLNASSLSSGTVPNSVLSGFQGSDNAIGGGVGNTINGSQSAILGGQDNTVNASQSSIGGGSGNNIQTGAYYALIGSGGGDVIQASAYDSVIGGGYHNLIGTNAIVSFIGSGQFNTISNNATFAVLGGGLGNTNTGPYSVIPGGEYNVAASNSFAAGDQAQATNNNTFVWNDGFTGAFSSTAANQFLIHATGGVGVNTAHPFKDLSVNGGMNVDEAGLNSGGVTTNALTFGNGNSGEGIGSMRTAGASQNDLEFYTDFLPRIVILNDGNVGIGTSSPAYPLQMASGAYCSVAGAWTSVSDRNVKEDFTPIAPAEVLARVAALPITQWKYKVEPAGTKHLGPMAQDFHAAFGLNGADDKHIATVDEDGVALAAIQGLNEKVETSSQNAEVSIRKLEAENAELKQSVDELRAMVKQLAANK
jgi:type VI secretion system secreted protein VgrG